MCELNLQLTGDGAKLHVKDSMGSREREAPAESNKLFSNINTHKDETTQAEEEKKMQKEAELIEKKEENPPSCSMT